MQGLGKTISNPKVFTLDNQVATITQGEEIPYFSSSAEGSDTSFKEAALKNDCYSKYYWRWKHYF